MNSNAPPTFAERLRAAVDAAGGPSKIGQSAGINRQTLTNWCKGKGEPGIQDAQKLAFALGLDIEFLATGVEPMRAKEPEATPAESPPLAVTSAAPALDDDFGGEVCAAILDLYRSERVHLSNARILAIGFEKYGEIAAVSADPKERAAMLQLVLMQLRKELRSGVSTTAQGNRSA